MTMQALTLSVSINRNWKDLYDAIWRPEAFQQWASGMAESTLEPDGDQWKARGPAGDVTIRFTAYNDFGVMDHTVRLANGDKSGDEIHVPLRVFANGDGAEVTLTLFRQPGMSDDQFAADADWVRRDLATLALRFST